MIEQYEKQISKLKKYPVNVESPMVVKSSGFNVFIASDLRNISQSKD